MNGPTTQRQILEIAAALGAAGYLRGASAAEVNLEAMGITPEEIARAGDLGVTPDRLLALLTAHRQPFQDPAIVARRLAESIERLKQRASDTEAIANGGSVKHRSPRKSRDTARRKAISKASRRKNRR